MKQIGLLLMLLLAYSNADADTLNARVTDSATGQPLPYAAIGIKGTRNGTIADDNGYFTLAVTGPEDTLIINLNGYNSFRCSLQQFIDHYNGKSVPMTATVHTLPAFVIRNTRSAYTSRMIGYDVRDSASRVGFGDLMPGRELGVWLDAGRKKVLLDSVRLNVYSCSYDSIFLRINIYLQEKRTPQLVLQGSYYIHMPAATAVRDGIIVDLAALKLQGYFLLSAETLKDQGRGNLLFKAIRLPRNRSTHRDHTGDNWRPEPSVTAGFAAYIREPR